MCQVESLLLGGRSVEQLFDFVSAVLVKAAVQPIAQLTIAILIGTIVALATSMTRLGAFMTFVCSMGSFVGFLMLSGFRFVSILASAGGIGLFLGIVGFYFWLSMWARSRRSKE